MNKLKLPRTANAFLYKPNWIKITFVAPYSSMLYCGHCGGEINPERFSIMECWQGHDLEVVGIYEMALKDEDVCEGWRMHHGKWVK